MNGLTRRWAAAGVLLGTFLSLSASSEEIQKTFASPQEAVGALVKACRHNDTKALMGIFGPDGKDIVLSGDRREDKHGRKKFAEMAEHKIAFKDDAAGPDKVLVALGDEDWPFPVPLVRVEGRWRFDPAEGRQEILARRIGSNEINAVAICRGYVEAQEEYAQDHNRDGVPEYAMKMMSSWSKWDGLYAKHGVGANKIHVTKGFATAARRANRGKPYHGYFFKVLTAQGPDAPGGKANYVLKSRMIGGFALAAWPAEYGVSGVKSFIVADEGIVYEKDLGPDSAKDAEAMTEFNPDKSWAPAPKD